MISFEEATKLNVDMLVFDVRATKDGELVIIHDPAVERTTNGTGRVNEMTLAEIKTLDVGSWKGEQFKNINIPTLIELCELAKPFPELLLNVEFKAMPREFVDKAILKGSGETPDEARPMLSSMRLQS